jgi:hypothetical protein
MRPFCNVLLDFCSLLNERKREFQDIAAEGGRDFDEVIKKLNALVGDAEVLKAKAMRGKENETI